MSANNPKGSDGMQLDDRKRIILQAIIRNYLETGEPVGSRTISKYTDLNLSSATIRNEMAPLSRCAADGSKTYDEIIDEWNEEWTSAQESCGVEIQ